MGQNFLLGPAVHKTESKLGYWVLGNAKIGFKTGFCGSLDFTEYHYVDSKRDDTRHTQLRGRKNGAHTFIT